MKEAKKYLVLALLLAVYMIAVAVLLHSFYLYQSAYHSLSRLISHSSIEVNYEIPNAKEE